VKISSSQVLAIFIKLSIRAIIILFIIPSFKSNGQGEALFKAKCATCHQIFKDGTGPKLYQVRQKWSDGGAKENSIILWVNNWSKAVAADPYAQQVSTWSPTAMNNFPDLSKDQITSIFDWIDSQEEVVASAGPSSEVGAEDIDQSSNSTWIWIILGVIFSIIILAVGGVRRQLQSTSLEIDGGKLEEDLSYLDELKRLAWKYRKTVAISIVCIIIGLVVSLFLTLYSVGVVENYQPSQPINFPHSIHAGVNGIDCKYCHNSVNKSKSAGLPTVNVCMNCHKQINGNTPEQQEQIQKIYAAAGYDPSGAGKYTGETKEIIWNKVHQLPDHVYFNHSQHVKVGGIDCKQCHGDMTKMDETVKVQSIQALNMVEGNIKLTKPTLTMGWCIECHGAKEISTGSLDSKKDGYYDEIHKRLMDGDKDLYRKYLEDGKVTVKELGGWECAKCHY
tara:strand:- start:29233 stop:30576 length:1344 start_codon:yes stop_codon:yes gene_type:complete